MVEKKICTICGWSKPVYCFPKNSCNSDGYHSQCKECRRERDGSRRVRKDGKAYVSHDDRRVIRADELEQQKIIKEVKRNENHENALAANAVYQRTYRREHKEELKVYHRAENNSIRGKARLMVSCAVAIGTLVRPDVCEDCGRSGVVIEAHHEDYSKPLDVIWVCKRKCHPKRDKLRRQREANTKLQPNATTDYSILDQSQQTTS